MGHDEWFRNTEWNDEIEAEFFKKLGRARDKSQRLRIQACTLRESHPTVALSLLERYFSLGDHFDKAQAYVDQAHAHEALGNVESAVNSYGLALQREAERPSLQTQAWLRLPLLVATHGLHDHYDRVLEILAERRDQIFPAQRFSREASLALILSDQGHLQDARGHAIEALRQQVRSTQDFGSIPT